jgi:S1-C subfamily serine protease
MGEAVPETAPQQGVRIRRTGTRGAAAGFQVDDIIVAVDGVTVRTKDQMDLVWRMRDDPEITFVVWRGGRHVTVHGALRLTWTSGSFASYDYRWPIQS